MALSDSEKIKIWNRLTRLENAYNALLEAIDSAISTESFNELSTVLQTSIDSVDVKIDDLSARVDSLEDIPLST
tara:strand:+ start:16 stop:237 length:222 start_codon:yes stop_codon:yes gene_type:complete